MTQRSYSLTLPMGTQVEIVIPGPTLLAAAQSMYKENGSAGWNYDDCLTMRALSSIDGKPVTDLSAAIGLDTKEYLTLKAIVMNLVEPNAQQLQTSIGTLVLLDSQSAEGNMDATSPIL